eukprot:CAMPEP_0202464740 /NCGR_PEP_ID=MMETSP1360-20130828/62916_1 /ASSEMBLY_ACC=CAM_ASM_000848 /TAXON_ID=515479 /ORGANISM="Licmophora paradoxa, Strain CCMP2313" /LENGTH=138 /DNA_ID=CAMNT_0049088165 /DNA_START=102 /DNA_END=518 /DNA_ORIENTATION=-
MKLINLIFLIITAQKAPILVLSQCLVGDIMHLVGDSTGIAQYNCINGTYYEGTEGVCQTDGTIDDRLIVDACPEAAGVPYCVQCGPPAPFASLCLSTPEVPSYCDIVNASSSSSSGTRRQPLGWITDLVRFTKRTIRF